MRDRGRARWRRVYRGLLGLLPGAFRRRYGRDLLHDFDALLRDARARGGAAAAHRRAARECRDVLRLVVRARLAAGGGKGPGWLTEVRLALRSLLRRPGYALTAVGTLALGVGASAAVFAVVDATLLRPLPYPEGDRLVMVWRVVERYEMRRAPVSLPDFADWRADAPFFEAAAGHTGGRVTLHGRGDPARLAVSRSTGDLFGVLRADVALGRPLLEADDRPGAEPVAVVSHRLWTERLGGDPAAMGRTLDLDGTAVRVVGVARPDFAFGGDGVDAWLPLRMDPARAERDMNFLAVVARLAPGVTLETADARMRDLAARVAEAAPGNEIDDVWLEPRRDFEVGDARAPVLLLAGAVGLLLLIACANLSALLLVRATGRLRELAVRSALGAGAGGLGRVLLAEALVLAAAGAAAGTGLAWLLVQGLGRLATPDLLPRGIPAVDARVVAFSVAAAGACALACSLLPARAVVRRGPSSGLGGGRGGRDRRTGRAHDVLAVAQVALATVLLVGGGLLGGSLARMLDRETGFDSGPVLLASVSLPADRYADPAAAAAFYDGVLERLSAHPAVEAAGASWAPPFTSMYAGTRYRTEDDPPDAEPRPVDLVPVRGEYFAALGIPVVEGRAFGPGDGAAGAPPVAVVSASLARDLWPGRERVVGRRLATDDGTGIEVVGVAGDVLGRGLDEDRGRHLYRPHAQAGWARDLHFVVRAAGDPMAAAPVLRRAVGEWDPRVPVSDVSSLAGRVSASVAGPRVRSLVVGGFAAAAALLALVGVYGVMAYRVADRRRDVALRMALGAPARSVRSGVLVRALVLGAAGLAVGLAAAAAAGRTLSSFLFGMSPTEPAVFAAVAGLVAATVAAAGWAPARRAARVDPMATLRQE